MRSNLNNILILIILSIISACTERVEEKCEQEDFQLVFNQIDSLLPEYYNLLLDTIDDNRIMLTIKNSQPLNTILERYIFNSKRKLIGYYFYNDFQHKNNPLLLTLDLEDSCKESAVIEGKAISYRIYELDTANELYVCVASPVFLKPILTIHRKGKKVDEKINHNINLRNNSFAYGLFLRDSIEIDYNYLINYYFDDKKVFSDSLTLSLPSSR